MWEKIARFILRSRWTLLIILLACTVVMGYHASKVQMSYEFTRAIPTDNPKYQAYQAFRSQFGEDGNLMAIGITTDKLFQAPVFNDYAALAKDIRNVTAVEDVLSVPAATNLVKDAMNEKLNAVPVFPGRPVTQPELDSMAAVFFSLPFYQGLMYDPASNTYMMGIRINKDVLNSKRRNVVVAKIVEIADAFGKKHNLEMHYSGLPLIRTNLATKVAAEMQLFLLGSIILSAIILLIFFRSLSATAISLAVVIIGVIWCMGTIEWMGYKITLLTGVIPPLIVVIGIPNCIYFLNKYHTAYNDINGEVFTNESRKRVALTAMISRMGIVTLFCNIAAAIGFAVFALTKSEVLKEFGVVAGINIMALFFISIMFIPGVLSILPDPKKRHTRYLENKWLLKILDNLERWSSHHKKLIYGITVIILLVSVAGMFKLKSVGFIVDDLPKTDKIYKDLKYFEQHFRGVMPLEIVVDTKQKQGLRRSPVQTFARIDSLSQFIAAQPEMARPLSIVEGLKFARQAYYNGDSAAYRVPNEGDLLFLSQYLSGKGSTDSSGKQNNFNRVVASFMDSNRRQARISVSMADVGSKRLPELISTIEKRSSQLFDTSKYHVTFTGTSVTFLEGSSFIINGLKESIMWAFLLIALCMLYLFRSFKILICSLIPNIIPLIITAGVMGWTGVAIKPSTVLVFSVALGIAIDITIRFLVNYRQELAMNSKKTSHELVIDTIHKTGISIIYTSLVLIAGFVIFCFSGFGGTQAIGWLTSLTLVLATLTNLIFLPALLLTMIKK
ncbi:efflux RND transporter permease subunit [Niastella populi]|uniref:RND transporter n=1 Tax=Niastella populi TaxID=550983 RepID=A0A1V9FJT2_9BACT|nr:MMPL family transporter [Niastella populi]OQP58541.1 RND transporter [Niastella populi]